MLALMDRVKTALIIFGIFLLVLGGYSAYKFYSTPVSFNQLSTDEYKASTIVEGTVDMNFGVYEQRYSTYLGIEDKSTEVWYYIVPVEDKYIGVAVHANDQGAEFDAQTEESYSYIEGKTYSKPRQLSIKGSITKMSEQDQGFFKEALIAGGYSAAEVEQVMVPYYILSGAFSSYMTEICIGAAALVLGIICSIATRKK